MTRAVLALLLAIAQLAGAAPVQASPPGLAGTHWERVARNHGLDPAVLYAVALAESGRPSQDGLAPWPWVVNTPKGPRFFESEASARAGLRELLASHRPIDLDVGLMQLNLHWHGDREADPAMLLDPLTNLAIAAEVLARALRSAPADRVLGVGRYHSWRAERARGYGRRVLRVAQVLAAHWGRSESAR